MKKIQRTCRVVGNENICPHLYRLRLDAPAVAACVVPGQFIHIRVASGTTPLLRRPFSVYRARGRYVEILYEVVGPGTALLSEKKRGDTLDILGPLGAGFSMPPRDITNVVLVAGGVGIAPFMILSDALKRHGYKPTLLYGARTAGHLHPLKEFVRSGCSVHIATDDGSRGARGRVTKRLDTLQTKNRRTMVYTCGPKPMMAAVQRFAGRYHMPGEASCEEVMACGLGACMGCAVKTTKGYKTACNDGPVFNLHELVF